MILVLAANFYVACIYSYKKICEFSNKGDSCKIIRIQLKFIHPCHFESYIRQKYNSFSTKNNKEIIYVGNGIQS